MASPNFVSNDPIATRALLEISQYSHDIRYKPGKENVTADALSRPSNIPPGDAYCPESDVVAAAKELVTNELGPEQIFQAQSEDQETANHLIGKSNNKIKT